MTWTSNVVRAAFVLAATSIVGATATSLAVAQSRPRTGHAIPRRSGADGGEDAPAALSADASPSMLPAGGGEATALAPLAPEEAMDGGRLSPLNPAANEFSDAGARASGDYERLLADIAALRARIAAVSDTLFHSRMSISLELSGDHARIAALSVALDDGMVWTQPPSFRPDRETVVYDHAVAPGRHAVTVEVERHDDREDSFRSSQRSRFVVEVPADRRLLVVLTLSDDSNMGAQFPTERDGRYDLRVRARAEAAR